MKKEWLRYKCQIALPGYNEAAQQQLQNAKVLIVGAGGLGCPVAQYLAAAGVGIIAIADNDVITVSNLHRQILYNPDEAGQPKAAVACKKLAAQNPQIKLIPIHERITSENAALIFKTYDIIVDGTDNFESKYLLNDACVLLGKPLVYGAIYQFEGQVAVWNIINTDGTRSPNYRDLFPNVNSVSIPNCADGGVLPTLAGIIGCMQATEVLKIITGSGELLAGKLLIVDANSLQTYSIKIGSVSHTEIKSIQPTAVVKTICVKDLKAKFKDQEYELADVRSKPEHEAFNIGGQHIPLEEVTNFLLKTHKPVVFYCATGRRSEEAAKLAKNFFPALQVFSLEGGIKAWQEQGM